MVALRRAASYRKAYPLPMPNLRKLHACGDRDAAGFTGLPRRLATFNLAKIDATTRECRRDEPGKPGGIESPQRNLI
jgi:hypothetical protein